MRELSRVATSKGYSVSVFRFLIAVNSLVAEHRLSGTCASVVVVHGLSTFSSQAESVGSVAVVRASAAPQHVGASQTRDETHEPHTAG